MNKIKINKILLDMDGVLTNLQKGVDVLLKSKGYIRDFSQPMFKENLEQEYGIGANEFWKIVDEAGHNFWENLEPYPWYKDLFNMCQINGIKFSICSTPSYDPFSSSGKLAWLQKHFGKSFRNYSFVCNKHLFAEPHTLLIDDRYCVTNKFHDAGGQVFLIPQFYNCNTALIDTEEKLKELQQHIIYETLPKFLKVRTYEK
jgi:hypothetical protein